MFAPLLSAFVSIRSWFRSRAALQVEILALRHQLTVLKRSQRGRPRLNSADRRLWVWLSRFWSNWRSVRLIVKPETVIAWHQRGFRWYWRWKSGHGEPERPTIDILVLNESLLRCLLKSYFQYYLHSGTPLALAKDAPEPRAIQSRELGAVAEIPEVGGLHHRYERRAA